MSKIVKLFGTLFSLLVLAVVVGAIFGYQMLQPIDPTNKEKKEFVVSKGQGIQSIGQDLYEAGMIKHPLAFRFTVWQSGLSKKIQAGQFLVSPSQSVGEIAQTLTKGVEDVRIKILEGWRVEEIADMLEQSELEDFDKKEFLALAKPDEGYLFPDSYQVPRLATAETIHSLLKNTFERKVVKGLAKEIQQSERDFDQAIIMASLIEREAREFEQMQMVSGILWNRVDDGMGLNVDATLQYLKGYDRVQNTWWPQPLAADKESSSPFNTYKHAGLPPAPIANPGLDAIRAALVPAKTDNVYYLHDRQGDIHYARTLDQHNANVQKYLR